FKPKPFYGVEAKTGQGLTFVWQDGKNNQRMFSKERADDLLEKLKTKPVHITRVDRQLKKQHAPQLYDLTSLQQDANRIFNFSGKKTLSVMQNLYERHKVLTYPRTDSRVLTTDIVPTLKERLQACRVDQYAQVAGKLLNKKF